MSTKELSSQELQQVSGGVLATNFVTPATGANLAATLKTGGSLVAVRCCACHCCSCHLPQLNGGGSAVNPAT